VVVAEIIIFGCLFPIIVHAWSIPFSPQHGPGGGVPNQKRGGNQQHEQVRAAVECKHPENYQDDCRPISSLCIRAHNFPFCRRPAIGRNQALIEGSF
jgi:hypothetical protein